MRGATGKEECSQNNPSHQLTKSQTLHEMHLQSEHWRYLRDFCVYGAQAT